MEETTKMGVQHVHIVVLTCPLGASNCVAKLTSAPVRLEVDKFHGKGSRLDTSVSGLQNIAASGLQAYSGTHMPTTH